jgi:hypothetical protein
VVVVVLVAVLAARVDHGAVDEETLASAEETTTTEDRPGEPSLAIEVEPGPGGEDRADAPDVAAGPTDAPSPAEAPPAPAPQPPLGTPAPPSLPESPDIGLALRPATAPRVYSPGGEGAPVLSWAVSGARSVRVEGPAGGSPSLLSTAAEGSRSVCPGTLTQGSGLPSCRSVPGTYDYTLIVESPDGALHTRRVTLTIQ